jgi:putative ABC transport system permease protein
VAVLLGTVPWASALPTLALGAAFGVLAALATLMLAALALRRGARRLAHRARGRPALRAALAAIGGPGSEAMAVVLSLGLGLSVLAAVGQIDWNLRAAIDRDLPTRAPAFFFIDIQPDQIGPFRARMDGDPQVSRTEPPRCCAASSPRSTAARARGGGRPLGRARRPRHLLCRCPARGEKTTITAGSWWPEGYAGAPQISFCQAEATELGLQLGDSLTSMFSAATSPPRSPRSARSISRPAGWASSW